MITHTPLVAGNLPIKTLVARRWPTIDITGDFCTIQCIESSSSQYQYFHVDSNPSLITLIDTTEIVSPNPIIL
jgi:hypothetical protein